MRMHRLSYLIGIFMRNNLISLYKLKGGWEGRYLQENIIHDSNLQVVRMVSWEE